MKITVPFGKQPTLPYVPTLAMTCTQCGVHIYKSWDPIVNNEGEFCRQICWVKYLDYYWYKFTEKLYVTWD